MAQLMPLTVTCSSKIQIRFTFLVLAYPGSPGQRAVKRVCVCVCVVCCLVRLVCQARHSYSKTGRMTVKKKYSKSCLSTPARFNFSKNQKRKICQKNPRKMRRKCTGDCGKRKIARKFIGAGGIEWCKRCFCEDQRTSVEKMRWIAETPSCLVTRSTKLFSTRLPTTSTFPRRTATAVARRRMTRQSLRSTSV